MATKQKNWLYFFILYFTLIITVQLARPKQKISIPQTRKLENQKFQTQKKKHFYVIKKLIDVPHLNYKDHRLKTALTTKTKLCICFSILSRFFLLQCISESTEKYFIIWITTKIKNDGQCLKNNKNTSCTQCRNNNKNFKKQIITKVGMKTPPTTFK